MSVKCRYAIFFISLLFLPSLAWACSHYTGVQNYSDKTIVVHLVGIRNENVTLLPGQYLTQPGVCTGSWSSIADIDGTASYGNLYSISTQYIEDTEQYFHIYQGPQYGVDFMNASHRIALDQDNHAAALTASINAQSNQVAAIQARSADLVKQQVDMKSSAFTSLVSKDVTAKLNADNLGAAVKSNIDTATAAYKKSTGDFFISNMTSTTLNNVPVIRTIAGQNTLTCGASVNDGVAYVMMNDNFGKFKALLLLNALNDGNPVRLDVTPITVAVSGGSQTYCFVKSISAINLD